mmetsp:Transcript_72190/g.199097  ORF Transcript_72190/g.199097 Transcript_72190/m.199097 type:complete len:247 (+) Transcript_72190:1684-2424(+)
MGTSPSPSFTPSSSPSSSWSTASSPPSPPSGTGIRETGFRSRGCATWEVDKTTGSDCAFSSNDGMSREPSETFSRVSKKVFLTDTCGQAGHVDGKLCSLTRVSKFEWLSPKPRESVPESIPSKGTATCVPEHVDGKLSSLTLNSALAAETSAPRSSTIGCSWRIASISSSQFSVRTMQQCPSVFARHSLMASKNWLLADCSPTINTSFSESVALSNWLPTRMTLPGSASFFFTISRTICAAKSAVP